jgi:hypothetical protein
MTETPPGGSETARDRVEAAVREVRHEWFKVAAVYAAVDAAVVALLVNLLVNLLAIDALPAEVAVPGGLGSLSTSSLFGILAGLVVGVGEFAYRARQPAVEGFERANPQVSEALRTARDAAADARDSAMAVRLYEDVLDRLRTTSSAALVDARRVAVPIVVLLVVSVLTVQVAVVDLSLDRFGDDDRAGPGDRAPDEYDGLRDGDEVLGDAEDVSAGDTEKDVVVGSDGSGEGTGGDAPGSYDDGGFATAGDVESQQAGYAPDERIEDADLIREYNLKIREEEDDQ